MARILALDYGLKRCGIAVTDNLQLIANPLTTIETEKLFDFLVSYCKKEQVEALVIGLPKRLNGEDSHITSNVKTVSEKLAQLLHPVTLHLFDERFTSKMAFNAMHSMQLGSKKMKDKTIVDQVSATLILQEYLQYKQKI
jgi:putative Holliday junction resolvase